MMIWIHPILPPLLSTILATCILWVGLAADAPCRRDRASDRHFVLLTACLGALAVLLLSAVLRGIAAAAHADPGTTATIWLGDFLGGRRAVLTASAVIVVLGSLAVLSRLLIGNAGLAWIVRRGAVARDPRITALARATARELGVREARVVLSAACDAPLTAGIVRPVIVLPRDAPAWSDQRLRVVLLHEYAHLKRRDPLTQIFAQALMIFFWWNPFFWRLWSRLRLTREIACDDIVVGRVVYAERYARVLLDFARKQRRMWTTGYGIVPMAQRSTVPERVRRLFEPHAPPSRLAASRTDVVVMTIAVVLTFSAIDVYGRNVAEFVFAAVRSSGHGL